VKKRIDVLLFELGLAPSRERAQSLILAGKVFVKNQRVMKASELYPQDALIEIKGEDHPYVSRGGVKLAGALDHFKIDVKNKCCLDIGASTGGFTDCLLQRGATRVHALDVGYGQLAWKLRQDSRVICLERQNFRHLSATALPNDIQFVVIDVSFISLKIIFPVLFKIFPQTFEVLALVKPQFEVGKDQVPPGGVVIDLQQHRRVLKEIEESLVKEGISSIKQVASSLKGADGNQEYFIFFQKLENTVFPPK